MMTKKKSDENKQKKHPSDYFLRTELFPSVFCQGCGIGTVINTFIDTIKDLNINLKKVCVFSGAGCTGKIKDYINLRSYLISDGYVINHAARLKKEKPESIVVAFINNADFLLSGASDFIQAAKNNDNIIILYINNLIYTVSMNKTFPITPFMRKSEDGNFELPFNIPDLVRSYGACYIARWTPLRAGWLKYSMIDVFFRKGLSVIEIVSPCLIYDSGQNRFYDPVERMKFYYENSELRYGENTKKLDLREMNRIITGIFLDCKTKETGTI